MESKRPEERIDEIVNKIGENKEPLTGPGSGEFEFDEASGSGLVFEYENAPAVEMENTDGSPSEEEISFNNPGDGEFSVPDAFEIDEKYDTPAVGDSRTTIWTTYVPRFTEASENYRMADDPRPIAQKQPPKAVAQVKKLDPELTATDGEEAHVDPTAESFGAVDDAIMVSMSKPEADENSETLSVYKFASDEQTPKEEKLDSVEAERENIRRLMPVEEATDEPEVSTQEVDALEQPTQDQAPEEKIYTIPDPEGDGIKVIDFSEEVSEQYTINDPDGAADAPPEMGKKGTAEFVHQVQRDGFKDKFLDTIMSVKIRFAAAGLFSLLLLAYESLAAMGVITVDTFRLSMVPGALAVFDLIFVVCLFLLALPEVVRSFKYLSQKTFLSDILLTVGLLIVLSYSLTVFFAAPREYPLFGFLYAVLVLCSIGSAALRLTTDFEVFKFVSQNKDKYILDKKLTRMLPEENIALDGAVDEYKSMSARIFRASFITDFFRRTGKTVENPTHTVLILSISLGVGIVTAVICFFVAGGIVAAISALALVFLLGCPAFMLISHAVSYFGAQKAALSEDSAVIGETSYDEFSGVDVIIFDDTEIFGPDDVNLKRFMLYGDRDNMDTVMRQMCSLFAVVGGPLDYIFASAIDSRVRYSPASSPVIEADGLEGSVGGHRIAAGTEEYMKRHGIAIPDGSTRPDAGIDTTKIMYASEDGQIHAKFYIRYSFSEEFTMLLPQLKEEGIIPLIYTRDPNVSNELLHTLTAGVDCIRVMKKLTPSHTEERVYRRVSSGVVTYGDKINAINIILLTKKYKKFGSRLRASELYAMGAGTALSVVLSLLGMFVVPSAVLGLWQIAWCAVLLIAGRRTFREKTDSK